MSFTRKQRPNIVRGVDNPNDFNLAAGDAIDNYGIEIGPSFRGDPIAVNEVFLFASYRCRRNKGDILLFLLWNGERGRESLVWPRCPSRAKQRPNIARGVDNPNNFNLAAGDAIDNYCIEIGPSFWGDPIAVHGGNKGDILLFLLWGVKIGTKGTFYFFSCGG